MNNLDDLSDVEEVEIRPTMKVLSLFDGIGTGKLILDQVNVSISAYYASEINLPAMKVASYNHRDSVIQVGDVKEITSKTLEKIGAIDLLIGGSPCQDFSRANPKRQGFEGPNGKLFFEYTRVKNLLKEMYPDHHLFWVYENVSSMGPDIRDEMSQHLQSEPTKWNSRIFTAMERGRYVWGNIPGIKKVEAPEITGTATYPELQEFLLENLDREAVTENLRTTTTRTNSLLINKESDSFPVTWEGKGTKPAIVELERLFGLPDHYTDIGRLSYHQRLALIGNAWDVHLFKTLFQPLRMFFRPNEK